MAQPFQRPLSDKDEPLRADPPVLTPEESRQGVISGRVMLILMTSLVLALIAFAIIYSTETV